MKKIDSKVLIVPPYISTNWSQVKALYVRDEALHVSLKDGDTIIVPGLNQEELERIFSAHAAHLDQSSDDESNDPKIIPPFMMFPGMGDQKDDNPFRISFSAMDNLGNMMQHNPEQSDAPELPREILEKVASIAKIVAPDELASLPKAEFHCNCVHCQIVRAMNPEHIEEEAIEELEVSEEELKFQQWDIVSCGDKIFTVTNRLDKGEQYKVCLDPIGCTCGQEGCEHIVCVLKS